MNDTTQNGHLMPDMNSHRGLRIWDHPEYTAYIERQIDSFLQRKGDIPYTPQEARDFLDKLVRDTKELIKQMPEGTTLDEWFRFL